MSPTTPDELLHALAAEIGTLDEASSQRLCAILRGLFSCMQDLNRRVEALEIQGALKVNGEN